MVNAIREQLELKDSLIVAQVVAEANPQMGLDGTGTLLEQVRLLCSTIGISF